MAYGSQATHPRRKSFHISGYWDAALELCVEVYPDSLQFLDYNLVLLEETSVVLLIPLRHILPMVRMTCTWKGKLHR